MTTWTPEELQGIGAAHELQIASRRADTSRVTRALSSRVFNRHISVSWIFSVSPSRLHTSRPTSAAAQSSVSATPGTLRKSSFRMPSTMRAICRDRDGEMPSTRAMMMRASRSTSG